LAGAWGPTVGNDFPSGPKGPAEWRNPLKILVVTSAWPTEGAPSRGIFIKRQVESLSREGVEVHLFLIEAERSKAAYVKTPWRLGSVIRKRAIDLVHAHYGYCGWVARLQMMVPVVVSFMGDDIFGTPRNSRGYTAWSRLALQSNKVLARIVDGVIVKSARMKTALGYQPARVIPNGVDFDLFRPIPRELACRELGFNQRVKRILFAGDPELPVKNFSLAQRATTAAKAEFPRAELVVARREPAERMPLLMNACDLLILTSLHEGSPNVVKEALACNLPVISVDVGDVKELVASIPGCYVTSMDHAEIARKIVDVLKAGTRTTSRERIAHLRSEAIAAKLLAFYREILGGN